MSAIDSFNLERFITAQDGTFHVAFQEVQAGRKQSHWMWFVFPQLRGLGHSPTAQHYGIASLDEARAYLGHPILGPRLANITKATLDCAGRSLHDLFGTPDDMKFRSSMTLFDVAAPNGLFGQALERWCGGERDGRTLALICGQ